MTIKRLIQKIGSVPALENKKAFSLLLVNTGIITCQAAYIIGRMRFLNPNIPLWYTRPWGSYQLAPANYIFVIPTISAALLVIAFFLINRLHASRNEEGIYTTLTLLVISNSFLFYSISRIMGKASSPFPPVLDRNVVGLIPIALSSFIICALLVPPMIRFAKKYGLVTDPSIHTHPGMLLKKPSARGGAVPFFLAFAGLALLLVPPTRAAIGLYMGALITTAVGLIDDKKNLSPYLRLGIMPLAIVATLILSDTHIYYIANPLSGSVLRLDLFQIPMQIGDLKFTFLPIADTLTVIWILWFMNMLSWSNAIDGQFSGMVAICLVVTAVLALRLLKIDPNQIHTARLAAIAAGASLGILPYNWHPSKIMWGFGAITMGLIIPILSIMAGTKVAVATLVLIVPTLDSIVTILRRILQKKSPVWGDRGHLHHRLLDMGLSQQEVSVLYWTVTALFGGVALLSSGKSKILALLTIGGLLAFILVAINLKGELGKLRSQQAEK